MPTNTWCLPCRANGKAIRTSRVTLRKESAEPAEFVEQVKEPLIAKYRERAERGERLF
jgi:hypothetical protein